MATPESIAIRRDDALARAKAAVDVIEKVTGAAFAPFPVAHRDWTMRPAIEAEWVAETLEAIAASVTSTALIPTEDDPLNEAPVDAPKPPQGDTSATDEQPDLAAMKRAELNDHAATLGVPDPHTLPNKDAVIAAITDVAATQGDGVPDTSVAVENQPQ